MIVLGVSMIEYLKDLPALIAKLAENGVPSYPSTTIVEYYAVVAFGFSRFFERVCRKLGGLEYLPANN